MDLPSLGEGHPQDKDKFESVVEREPVDGIHRTLENRQKRIDNPILRAVSIRTFRIPYLRDQLTVNHWVSSDLVALNRASKE